MGKLTIGDLKLDPLESGYYALARDEGTEEMKNMFGRKIPIAFSGDNGFPAFNASFYMPQELIVNYPLSLDKNEIKKSEGFELKWEAQPAKFEDDLFLQISQFNPDDATLNRNKQLTIKDDGHYFIDAKLLSYFPSDQGQIQVKLLRFEKEIMKAGNKSIEVMATSKVVRTVTFVE